MIADIADHTLDSFFSRPVKIAQYDWTVGTTFYQSIDPWALYWQNLRVINRITNYNLLRARMHVKVMINGNGFFYGRLLASYSPLPNSDSFGTNRALIAQDLIQQSQLPHFYIDPTTSTGGQMILPFFWPKNTLNIPDQDWSSMGRFSLRSFGNLKHANGAATSVSVSVFAWAEDVSMHIPTAAEPGSLAPQAGDEYGNGPISKVASTVARVAGALTLAPVIRPYALATEMAASTVADVARLFGYSRPVTVAENLPVVVRPVGNMANFNMIDPSVKLSLDVKQELSIDPRISGVGGQDELELRSIAMRESFLCSVPWTVAGTSESTLFSCRVNPVLHDVQLTEYHLTPSAHVSLPFKYWRGSMEFRFQIIASNFHKGRLAVGWDPNYFQSTEYNVQYTRIIDIAEEKDFTIKIGWGNAYSYLQTRDPGTNSFPWSTGALGVTNTQYDNGVINLRILNTLTVPNSTPNNDVSILVSTKMCDDFELAEPDDKYTNYVWFSQSGEEVHVPDSEGTDELAAPISAITTEMVASPLSPSDATNHVYMGEAATTVRQLLKRYFFYGAHAPTASVTTLQYLNLTKCNFPLYRGNAPGAVHTTTAAAPYNYFSTNAVTYFTPVFAGVRGGMRWKYLRSGSVGETNRTGVSRIANATTYALTSAAIPVSGTLSALNRFLVVRPSGGTSTGAAESNSTVSPVLEVELPFYTQNRFFSARLGNPTTTWEGHNVYGTYGSTGVTLANTCQLTHEYCSVGEDFSLFWYLSVPRMFYEPTVPA